jgi:hypothetical protein
MFERDRTQNRVPLLLIALDGFLLMQAQARSRKNKRRESLRAGWVTYSGADPRVKATSLPDRAKSKENQPIPGVLARPADATIGFPGRCPASSGAGAHLYV